MANRAYSNTWVRNFSEETLLEMWEAFLRTVPFSTEKPGFRELIIRAVDSSQPPILEQDLSSGEYGAEVIVNLSREHVHSDCAYETQAFWDLWIYDASRDQWRLAPQPLGIYCYGEDFDEGFWSEQGHFAVDAGFEHLFTGHAGILGVRRTERAFAGETPVHQTFAERTYREQPNKETFQACERHNQSLRDPQEQNFLALMSQPGHFQAYQEKTRENIRKLFGWMERVEAALSVEHFRLWSEGEDNFEARMEEILAAG